MPISIIRKLFLSPPHCARPGGSASKRWEGDRPGRWLPALGILLLGGCDIPTEIPRWDTTWIIPVEGTSVGVTSLLPSSVSTVANGSQFAVSIQPVTFSQNLGQLCPPCIALHGQTVPKLEFTRSFSGNTALPSEVLSAQLTSGGVTARLQHDLSFDPIRPSASARGRIVLVLTSGARELSRDTINGVTTAFPPGQALVRNLALSAGPVSGVLTLSVELFSPAGDPVTIDRTDILTVTATPQSILLSEAQIRVTNRTVSANEAELDVGEIDDAVADRVRSGALLLNLDDALSFSGNLTFTATAAQMAPIQKTVALQAGATSARLDFTEPEIRSILANSPVVVNMSGTVSTPVGGTTIRPSQVFEVGAQLELTIGPNEN